MSKTWEEVVEDAVKQRPGIHGPYLAGEAITRMHDEKLDLPEIDFANLLEEMVKQKRLIEVEYVLPDMDYRIKSLYFPVGTEIRVK
jgi:hypothetical protein